MIIRELYLKNFGKFSDYRLNLNEGINVIYGENEFGKTTVHAFIKSMLFGLERGRGRASKRDAFTLYEPWDNPNYYTGMIKFSCGDKQFSLERTFDKYSKKTTLICENDGEVLSVEHGDLEMLLEGMTADSFENTISIGQLKVEPNKDLVIQLKDYASNYYGTANSDIHLQEALSVLANKKKMLHTELKQIQSRQVAKRDKVEQEASYIWKDIKHITDEIGTVEEEIHVQTLKLSDIYEERMEQKECNQVEEGSHSKSKGTYRWRIHPFLYIAMAGLVTLPFVVVHRPWNYLWALVIVLAEGLFVWNRLKDGNKKQKASEEQNEVYQQKKKLEEVGRRAKRKATIEQALEKLMWQKEHLQSERKEKQITYSNLQEHIQELQEVSDEYKEKLKNIEAIELAMCQMEYISQDIHKDFGEVLNEKASAIIASLTEGKYERLYIDRDLRMTLYAEGKVIGIEQVSRGTIEQIYFALRMAAVELLYEDDFPVILDDAFVFYDERRLEQALKWLKKHRKQVIVFTCQKRENEVVQRLG
ncbi:ATP-binding protein [Lachnospiraceae bacterium LCP25S3_G4]